VLGVIKRCLTDSGSPLGGGWNFKKEEGEIENKVIILNGRSKKEVK
jgi:hypothetical protein